MSKKLFSKVFILLLVVGLLFAVAPTKQAQAAEFTVNPGESIQTAITAASPGDTIIVAAGTYTENITINKALSLQGAGRDFVTLTGITTGDSAVVSVSASDVTIKGFSFQAPLGGKKVIKIIAATSGFQFLDNRVTTADNPTNINGYAGIETNNGLVQTDHIIDGNIFVSNHTSQMVYYNPTTVGLTFTDNQFIGTHMPNGVVFVIEALSGTFDISGNSFADTLVDAYGLMGLPGLTEAQMDAVFDANTFPTGAFVDGIDIRYIQPIFVDDNFTDTTVGWGVTHFATIQEGINAVGAGGTVNVAEGTYNENLTINKALTLQGAGDERVTVNGVAPTSDAGMLNIVASDVTIDGFKFVGVGNKTVRLNAPSTNVTFSNNTVIGAEYNGVGAWDLFTSTYNHAHSNLTITGNVFENNGGQIGVYLNPQITGLTFTGNTFQGDPTSGPVLGIDGMLGTEVITGNTFNIGSSYALFEAFGTYDIVNIFDTNTWPAGYIATSNKVAPASVVYPSTNDINRTNGWAHVDFVSADATARTMTFDLIQTRSFYSCVEYRTNTQTTPTYVGLYPDNPNTEILDGRWTATCRNTPGTTPITITLDSGATYVEFRLSYGAEKLERFYWTPFTFVPEVWVDDSFTGTEEGFGITKFLTIQEGIDAVATGGTVHVADGTYYGPLTIDKQLSLIGPNSGIDPNTGTRVAEAVILYPAGLTEDANLVTVNADGVTIDGFTIDGKDLDAGLWGEGIFAEANDLTVKNNIIKNFMQIGVRIYSNIAGPYYSGALIENNQIISDVAGRYFSYSGIYLQGTHGEVRGNVVDDAYRGIQIQPYNHPSTELGIVEYNTFSAYKSPIYFNYSSAANGDWVFRRNIATGIVSPEASPVDYFGGITVQTFGGGNVLFDKNQVTLGATDATSKYLYYEIGTVSGTSSATPNWWGSVTGPAEGSYSGDAEYLPYCLDPECTLFSQAKLSMSPATIEALTCGSQTLDVLVTDVVDLTSYHLEIDFDETKVRIDSVVNGGFLVDTENSIVVIEPGTDLGNTTGKLKFGAYLQANEGFGGDPAPVTGTGTLITITFTPLLGSTDFTVDSTNSLLVSWPDAFAMPFSATGATATLTGGLVKNVDTSVNYCSLATAVADATSGEGLQLLESFSIPATVTIDKALTLDLNGKTISATGTALNVTGAGALTIDDFSTGTAGSIIAGYRGAQVSAGGSLTLKKGTLAGNGFDGVFVYGEGSTVNVDGGTITGLYYGISGNGSTDAPYDGATAITINSGIVQGGETAIFHPEEGLLKITGGDIIGGTYNGIEMKAGDLEITGGTITTAAAFVATPAQTGNGNTQSGDAILIYNRAGYQGTMTVEITGGTITSTHGYALREYTYTGETTRTTLIDVTGGSFTGGIGTGDAGAAVTFMTTDAAVLKLTDGQYNTDPGLPAADFVYTPYDTYFDAGWFMIDPVDITATTLAGLYTAGVPATVTVTVADTDHTGPFEVVFDYPEGTSITYGATTVVCGSTGCDPIVVTLSDPGPTDLSFDVTLPGAGTYDVGVELYHNAGTGDIRLLDSDTATDVVVSGDFTVTGTFSMQGRVTRGDIPVTLTWGGTLVPYGPSANTTDVIDNNFTLLVSYGGTYTITTNQARYLNVITATGKTILVDGNEILPALRLRGGNAVWMNSITEFNDVIDGGDASLVGTQYGTAGADVGLGNHGDCNFDGIVNIQDLALVGGNFDLTSTSAYATWLP